MICSAPKNAFRTLVLAVLAAGTVLTAYPQQANSPAAPDEVLQPAGTDRQSIRSGSLAISASEKTNPATVKEESLPVIALDASNVREIPRSERQPIRNGKREIALTSPVPDDSLAARLADEGDTIHIWRPAFGTQGFRGIRLDAFAVSPDGSVLAIAERTGIATGPNGTRIVLLNTHTWDTLRIFTTDLSLKKLAFVPANDLLAAVAFPQPELKQKLELVAFDLKSPDCAKSFELPLNAADKEPPVAEKVALLANGGTVFCSGYNGTKALLAELPASAEGGTARLLEFTTRAPATAMAVTPDGSRVALASQKDIEYFSVARKDGAPTLSSTFTTLDLGWYPVDLKFLGGAQTDFIVCPSFDEDSPPVVVRSSAKDSLDGRSAGFAVPCQDGKRIGVAFKVKGRIDVVNPATIEVEDSVILDQMRPATNGTAVFVHYLDPIHAFFVVDTVGNAFAVGKNEGDKRWSKRIIWNGAGKR